MMGDSKFLVGKKIIFFAPVTFGYEKAILQEMESLGAEVLFHSILPSEKPWVKVIFRIFPRIGWIYADIYFISWIKKFGPAQCDFIFVIKGDGLSPKFLKLLRERYPGSRYVMYLWDSIKNCKHVHLKFPSFDELFSFDPYDCLKFSSIKYRPLFFLPKYLKVNSKNLGSGVFFIGTLNGDRPRIISQIFELSDMQQKFKYWLLIRSRVEFILRFLWDKSLRKLDSSRLIYHAITPELIAEYYGECSAVLDIEHPDQSGLTIRTFEVLASEKKLITTNVNIRNHDFYDSARICIIDRKNPVILENFLTSPCPKLPDNFFKKYSLGGWIRDILK